MAVHMNTYFDPTSEIDAQEITFAAGVTALSEACAMAICDEGDAIMLPTPVYDYFDRDLAMRTG